MGPVFNFTGMIPQQILYEKGGTLRTYIKNQVIFFEGSSPSLYYQIVEGAIKAISTNENGKEFIQGLYKDNQFFGMPALLTGKPYPVTAMADEETVLITLAKQEFLDILKEFPELNDEFIKTLGSIIYDYSLIAKAISTNNPQYKILTILRIQKENHPSTNGNRAKIELSRQQIADITGLRVETVIRTIKNMEKKLLLKIQKGKIYF